MIIYNPHNELVLNNRAEEASKFLNDVPAKHCFISGSFLYSEKYKDIDLFIISRSKKEIKVTNGQITINRIDFNDLYSLFYQSVSKSCIAKNTLPTKPLKVTITDYWGIINQAVPALLNQKDTFHKNIRSLVLYTEFFKTRQVLDSFQLIKKVYEFRNYTEVLAYINQEVPHALKKEGQISYLRRFFYTQTKSYKNKQHDSQNFVKSRAHHR